MGADKAITTHWIVLRRVHLQSRGKVRQRLGNSSISFLRKTTFFVAFSCSCLNSELRCALRCSWIQITLENVYLFAVNGLLLRKRRPNIWCWSKFVLKSRERFGGGEFVFSALKSLFTVCGLIKEAKGGSSRHLVVVVAFVVAMGKASSKWNSKSRLNWAELIWFKLCYEAYHFQRQVQQRFVCVRARARACGCVFMSRSPRSLTLSTSIYKTKLKTNFKTLMPALLMHPVTPFECLSWCN